MLRKKFFSYFVVVSVILSSLGLIPFTKTPVYGASSLVAQLSRRLGSTGNDLGYDIATDVAGNIIIVGKVTGNADFDGDGNFTLDGESSVGYAGSDIFVASFSSSSQYIWSHRLGGTSSEEAYGVSTDSNGNVIVVGGVQNAADLNGNGVATDGGNEDAINGANNNDIFISSFSSDGTFGWSQRLGGTGFDLAYSVTTDVDGNVIVGGIVTGDADLRGNRDFLDDGESSVGYGSDDAFLTSFSSAGTYRWSRRLGGVSGSSDQVYAVDTDIQGNVFITGSVRGDADLNWDGDFLDDGESSVGYGANDIFVTSLTSNGSYQWSRRLGGTSANNDYGEGIITDTLGNVIVVGSVAGDVDLNWDGDSLDTGESSVGYGASDVFVTSLTSSTGAYLWSKRLGGTGWDGGQEVAIDENNNVIVTGFVIGNVDLNGDGDSTDGAAEDGNRSSS